MTHQRRPRTRPATTGARRRVAGRRRAERVHHPGVRTQHPWAPPRDPSRRSADLPARPAPNDPAPARALTQCRRSVLPSRHDLRAEVSPSATSDQPHRALDQAVSRQQRPVRDRTRDREGCLRVGSQPASGTAWLRRPPSPLWTPRAPTRPISSSSTDPGSAACGSCQRWGTSAQHGYGTSLPPMNRTLPATSRTPCRRAGPADRTARRASRRTPCLTSHRGLRQPPCPGAVEAAESVHPG